MSASTATAKGTYHWFGECETCGKRWGATNVVRVCAQHARRNPTHVVRAEVGYVWEWDPRVRELRERRGK